MKRRCTHLSRKFLFLESNSDPDTENRFHIIKIKCAGTLEVPIYER